MTVYSGVPVKTIRVARVSPRLRKKIDFVLQNIEALRRQNNMKLSLLGGFISFE